MQKSTISHRINEIVLHAYSLRKSQKALTKRTYSRELRSQRGKVGASREGRNLPSGGECCFFGSGAAWGLGASQIGIFAAGSRIARVTHAGRSDQLGHEVKT